MRRELKTLVLALTLTAFAVAVVPAVAPAKTQPTCKRPGSKTVAENRVARVFTRPARRGNRLDLLGCWKSSGRAFSLTYPLDSCEGPISFDLVRLRGRFAAFYSEARSRAQCFTPERPIQRSVHIINLRNADSAGIFAPARPAGGRLLLDARGAVVWPDWLPNNQIQVLMEDHEREGFSIATPYIVDSGPIHPESLRLTLGGRLDWINGATPRSMQLDRSKP